MSLPYYSKFGWEATVLCATPGTSDGVLDEALERTVPPGIRVERVSAWPESVCRRFGFGHFNYRCLYPLYRRGSALLSEERYDAVFFSTTAFTTFVLGPLWRRRFGCRIVYDYQDPWHAGEREVYDRSTAPGGMLKYKFSSTLAGILEPYAMKGADHIISVSPGYVTALRARYPLLEPGQFTVLPFGAPAGDFELLARQPVRQRIFDRADGRIHFVSIGRGGPDMNPVLDELFRQVAALRRADPQTWNGVSLHFVGTNYSPAKTTYKVVEPIAANHGVADLVDERSERVPYLEALQALKESHGVMLVGSIFPEYTPSKLFSCVLSGRPVLAILNRDSLATRMAGQFTNLKAVTFAVSPGEPDFGLALAGGLAWMLGSRDASSPAQNESPGEYSAEELTRRQCQIFDRILESGRA